jgi:hypothetical protein
MQALGTWKGAEGAEESQPLIRSASPAKLTVTLEGLVLAEFGVSARRCFKSLLMSLVLVELVISKNFVFSRVSMSTLSAGHC